MTKHRQNDGHEQDYINASEARIRADRMAMGLPCLVDPVMGDLNVVIALKARLNEWESWAKHNEFNNSLHDF